MPGPLSWQTAALLSSMAAEAYLDVGPTSNPDLPSGWSVLRWPDLQNYSQPDDPISGLDFDGDQGFYFIRTNIQVFAAYNDDTNQLVISIRGTDELADWGDYEALGLKIQTLTDDIAGFVAAVQAFAAHERSLGDPVDVYLAGHSLGGAVAEATAAFDPTAFAGGLFEASPGSASILALDLGENFVHVTRQQDFVGILLSDAHAAQTLTIDDYEFLQPVPPLVSPIGESHSHVRYADQLARIAASPLSAGFDVGVGSVAFLEDDGPTTLAIGTILVGHGVDTLLFAGKYDDFITAAGFNTFVWVDGGGGSDQLIGSAFNDRLSGGVGTDTLAGLTGNDVLYGGGGIDYLSGGAGNDTLIGGAESDFYSIGLGEGQDTIADASGLTDTLRFFFDASFASYTLDSSTPNEILISARNGANAELGQLQIFAQGSSLLIIEFNGAHQEVGRVTIENMTTNPVEYLTLFADDADHQIGQRIDLMEKWGIVAPLPPPTEPPALQGSPDSSADILSDGVDTWTGSFGDDTVWAKNGGDTIDTTLGNDTIFGGGGDDTLTAGDGNDQVLADDNDAQAGDDTVYGGTGDDLLVGLSGNDILDGGADDDALIGGAGNDTLVSGTGVDWIDGGSGTDWFDLNRSFVNIDLSISVAAASTNAGLTLADGTYVRNVEHVMAISTGGGNDTICDDPTDHNGDSSFNTGPGNDTVTIYYGGRDEVHAASGFDRIIIDFAAATGTVMADIFENSGAGDVYEGASFDTATHRVLIELGEAFQITSGSGNDHLAGAGDDDVLVGNGGDDLLEGRSGNDRLEGGAGNDTLVSGTGVDWIDGGSGTDWLDLNRSFVNTDLTFSMAIASTNAGYTMSDGTFVRNVEHVVAISTGGGNDTIWDDPTDHNGDSSFNTGPGNDTVTIYYGGRDEVHAGSGFDRIIIDFAAATGTVTADIFENSGYNDVYEGASFDTATHRVLIELGEAFQITSGSGNDHLAGAGDDDVLVGNGGDDLLEGRSGNDRLEGGAGSDTLSGGAGTDTASYASSTLGVQVNLSTGTGAGGDAQGDVLDSIENLIGSGQSDLLTGNAGVNRLEGGAGNDTLDGGAGADAMIGGDGNDTYVIDNVGDTITENSNEGIDAALITVSGYTLGANVEVAAIQGSVGLTLTGNSADNALYGAGGDDTINGGDGNDTIRAGAGNDTMAGGLGSDTYIVAQAGDVVVENSNEGIDVVVVQIGTPYTLTANVEIGATFLGTAVNITGNGLDNLLYGNAGGDTLDGAVGNDTIQGGAGIDTMIGGTGNDTYFIEDVGDVITENSNEGTDAAIVFTSSYTLAANVEVGARFLTSAYTLTGNALDNQLYGNAGNDTLNGGDGNDTLQGGGGNDTLTGGIGNDTYIIDDTGDVVVENNGEGTDAIILLVSSYTLSANAEVGATFLTSATSITGNGLDNRLYGNSGGDTLDGGAGNDFIQGSGGVDTLIGGTGNDVFLFDAGQSNGDIITDFNGAGAGAGDVLRFSGYGTTAGGATFIQVDATPWQINSANGLIHDTITLSNGASIDASDWLFV